MKFPKFELLPFQEEDAKKLALIKGRLIANEMGTGKTYEAIALDLILRKALSIKNPGYRPKTLVVAPLTTLKSPWESHIKDLTNLKVRVISPKRREIFLRDADPDVFVLHWEAIRWKRHKVGTFKNGRPKYESVPPKGLEDLFKIKWDHIIADELHRAKNRKAQQTVALKKLKTTYKTGLTGTPIANKPDDIWSILNWVWPDRFRSYWSFFHTFIDATRHTAPNGASYWKINGVKNEKRLQKLLDLFYVSRKKEDVLPDLPSKYYTEIRVDLGPKEQRAYNQMLSTMLAWLEVQDETVLLAAPVVIAQLTRLKQLACAYHDGDKCAEPSAKLDAVMEIILDNSVKEFNGKIIPSQSLVIFSTFKQIISLLEKRLAKENIEYVRITGDDPQIKRESSIRKFQSGYPRIFLGTIGAGSEGITLTRSSTVIFIDRDRTPAGNAQAEDRVHRIGQNQGVQIITIMANGTTDFKDLTSLEYKKEWIKKLLEKND